MTTTRSFSGRAPLSMLSCAGLVFFALLGGTGCAGAPQVGVDGLALRRVVVYRNGVAYFERAGRVTASQVKFRVRGDEVNDFLATMAVMETGGSSVRSASFPLKVEEEKDAEPPPFPGPYLKPLDGPDENKKKKDKLVNVLLSLDGREHDLQVGYVAETPVWRPTYRLVVHQDGSADLQAWGIVQNLSGEDWKNVQLSLIAGAPLAFQPTLGTPMIPPRPTVTDMGEVIGAIPLGETTLAQGAPPPPPKAEMPYAPAPMDISMAEASAAAAAAADEAESANIPGLPGGGGGRGYGSGKGSPAKKAPSGRATSTTRGPNTGGLRSEDKSYYQPAPPPPPPPPRPSMAPSAPKNLASLAAIALEGSTTRYDIPTLINVPDKSATMVMLISQKVAGESSFLFSPDGGVPDSTSHPFRVARFTNQTAGLLERGPIAVFEDGAFLGQGMVSPLPPNAVTTVPFALERAISVEHTTTYGEEGARLAKIEAGEMYIERDTWTKTKYTLRNGTDKLVKVLVKHPRRGGTRLYQPPKGTEDNIGTGTALIPSETAVRETSEMLVDERSTYSTHSDWLSELANEAVMAYIADPRADAGVVAQLKTAWAIRPELIKLVQEERRLREEQDELSRNTEETRRNLKALEKNKTAEALKKTLADRLTKASARLDEISKRLVEVRMSLGEKTVAFKEATRTIKMLKPLPPPT